MVDITKGCLILKKNGNNCIYSEGKSCTVMSPILVCIQAWFDNCCDTVPCVYKQTLFQGKALDWQFIIICEADDDVKPHPIIIIKTSILLRDDQRILIKTSSCNLQFFFRTNYYSIERFSHGVTASCLYFTYLPHHAKLQVLPKNKLHI